MSVPRNAPPAPASDSGITNGYDDGDGALAVPLEALECAGGDIQFVRLVYAPKAHKHVPLAPASGAISARKTLR